MDVNANSSTHCWNSMCTSYSGMPGSINDPSQKAMKPKSSPPLHKLWGAKTLMRPSASLQQPAPRANHALTIWTAVRWVCSDLTDAQFTDVFPHLVGWGKRAVPLDHGVLFAVSSCLCLRKSRGWLESALTDCQEPPSWFSFRQTQKQNLFSILGHV